MKHFYTLFVILMTFTLLRAEENPMRCDSVKTFSADGTVTSKVYYNYSENGYLLGQINYDWSDWYNHWISGYKSEYSRDDDGNIIEMVVYVCLQGDINQWNSKDVYTYDKQGYINSEATYGWYDGQWKGSYKSEYSYDNQGNRNGSARYEWYDGQWIGNDKYESLSDGTYLKYVWVNNQWEPWLKTESTFNDHGDCVSSISYKRQNGQWENISKRESTYDDKNNETGQENYSWIDNQWVGTRKYGWTYDVYGNRFVAFYHWEDNQWVGDSRDTEYTYDNYGNKTSEIRYHWENGQWVGTVAYKYEYTYDDHANIISKIVYWLGDTYQGKEEYKYENTYDDNGNLIKKLEYFIYDKNHHPLRSKCEFTYDEQGHKTSEAKYDRIANLWEGIYKEDFIFNEYTNEYYMTIRYFWENGQWVPENYNIWVTLTDETGLFRRYYSCEWENGQWVYKGYTDYDYTYDENGDKIETRTNLDNGEWIVTHTKTVTDRDMYNNITKQTTLSLQDDQWVISSYKIYYYHDITNAIETIRTNDTTTDAPRKVLRNGKIHIESNGRSYGIGGQFL